MLLSEILDKKDEIKWMQVIKMDEEILKKYAAKFVKLVYYTDEVKEHTASIKGVLFIYSDSFSVEGDFTTISGLIKDIKSIKEWIKDWG